MQQRPMTKPSIHLICNAHLDPVWLWEWEEGAAEALSTFRTAADFCEEYGGFVFNHNEAILYEWIDEYEPALFERIQRLVKVGKWKIMGGWYLQPDCNMPCGESFVRQILLGRTYFKDKFDASPTTAVHFDPFGHTRGLVQILAKSGFNAYLFCRPSPSDIPLDSEVFQWEGVDGSRVLACRVFGMYLSARGTAAAKVKRFIEAERGQLLDSPGAGCVCWGIGNHGGGPSRIDIEQLDHMIKDTTEFDIRHSDPDAFFDDVAPRKDKLPVVRRDLNPWGPGCYTSQVRIKQLHCRLENQLFMTEKMLTAAWAQGLLEYPADDLKQISKRLAYSQFHDILPGSAIQTVEDYSLQLLGSGLDIVSRLRARAFFALSSGQPRAAEGEIPVLVYNPHPWPVETDVECEFQLADQNWEGTFTDIKAYAGERALPTQVEKEASNLNLDWRKNVVFHASLEPASMNRFDCKLERISERTVPNLPSEGAMLLFRNDRLAVDINRRTGLIDRFAVDGKDYLDAEAFRPLVIEDNANPWGCAVHSFRKVAGRFTLMTQADAATHAGVKSARLPAVRVVEDGPVRTVVEAALRYNHSTILLTYRLPKHGTGIEIHARVQWNEKDRMLKLSVPTALRCAVYKGQTAYGIHDLPVNGNEAVAHKWVTAVSEEDDAAVRVINNGSYGSDFKGGEIRLSLLRSSAYSALPIGDRELVRQDRFTERIDQGERTFTFRLNAGGVADLMPRADRAALEHNEQPMALSFFPSGSGETKQLDSLVEIADDRVVLTAAKKAEKGDDVVLRFFEPAGRDASATVRLPWADVAMDLKWTPFEIKTVAYSPRTGEWRETNLLEWHNSAPKMAEID